MKKLLTLIIIISSFARAQFYEIEYEMHVQTHYTEKGLKWFEEWEEDPKDRQIIIDLNMNPPIENYQFVFNENFSSSNLIRKVDNSQDDQTIFVNKTAPTFGENAFIDYKENKFWAQTDVYGDKYLSYDSVHKVNFEDTGKTKEILGKQVKEAVGKIGKYDLIAWYAPSIDYKFSPDIFYGTNGLILELHYKYMRDDIEVMISWNAIKKKESKKAPVFKINNQLKKVSQAEFFKMIEDSNQIQREENNQGIDKK